MKGDFTRLRFDPEAHYDSVLMQQGRVQTDADWNEQVLIAEHRSRTQVLDLVGRTGAPQDHANHGPGSFQVQVGPDSQNQQRLFISPGRYYVDGLLVEGERPVRYDSQPGAALPPPGGAGAYLLFLDIWKRHVTAVEEPAIREVALAGMDSGTRSQIVWQARLERLGDLGLDIGAVDARLFGPDWVPAGAASTGVLDVQARGTLLGNHLYRVEVHRGGDSRTASFKWSRDNGIVVSRALTHTRPVAIAVDEGGVQRPAWRFRVTVDSTGRDGAGTFRPGNLVELSCEELILQRQPGVFGKVTHVAHDVLDVEVIRDPALVLGGTVCTVRRWDNAWNPDHPDMTLQHVGAGYGRGDRLLIEQDLTIRFAAVGGDGRPGSYQTGDYWLIPTRTVSGLEQWAEGQPQRPAGEKHTYAPLALVKIQTDGTVANPPFDLRDVRDVFPTLRSLAAGVGAIVQGTGDRNRLPKWQSTGGPTLLNSNITDDGGQVTVEVPLMVGTAADSRAISRFTSSNIESMAAADLSSTAPTAQGVKHFIEWAVPAGTVVAYASETVPAGWLECNGFQYDGAPGGKFGRLFEAIGKTHGPGNGSTYGFNVPDLRGVFIRGWSHGHPRDPDRDSRIGGGDRVGSYQDDLYASHGHSFSGSSGTTGYASSNHAHEYRGYVLDILRLYPPHWGALWGWGHEDQHDTTGEMSHNHNHSIGLSGSIRESGGRESRPKNVYLMYIIKL